MALTRDRKRINVKGGGKLQIRETHPSASDTFLDIGYISKSDFSDEHTMVESVDEQVLYVETKSGAQKVSWVTTIKQTGIDEINLLKNADGKYYELYYYVLLANGNYQELHIPLAKITAGTKLSFGSAAERSLDVTFQALSPKAGYTYSENTTFNVTANVPYVLVENSSLQFVTANTQAGELATAIL